jgi:hypothetical protein
MTRLHTALATLLVAFAPQLFAQSNDEAALARALATLDKAIVTADKALLENIAWPELSYGHGSGRLEGHAEFVQTLVTRKNVITRIEPAKSTTTIVGDLAIVRGHSFYMVETSGKPVPAELDLVMVWQKRGGEWKLLVRQAFRPQG